VRSLLQGGDDEEGLVGRLAARAMADVKVDALLDCLMAINRIPEASTASLIKMLTQYKPEDDDDSLQETSAVARFHGIELAIRSVVMLSLQALEHCITTDL
jgi:hypothetical protein